MLLWWFLFWQMKWRPSGKFFNFLTMQEECIGTIPFPIFWAWTQIWSLEPCSHLVTYMKTESQPLRIQRLPALEALLRCSIKTSSKLTSQFFLYQEKYPPACFTLYRIFWRQQPKAFKLIGCPNGPAMVTCIANHRVLST